MFAKQIETIDELPLADRDRKCTDVCCTICGLLFFLFMLASSLIVFNRDNYYKVNFPTDSEYRSCSHDLPGYPYAYFGNPNGDVMANRVCVAACPKASDKYLLCAPTNKTSCRPGIIYDTVADHNRLGGLCLPTDLKSRNEVLENTNLTDKWRLLNFYDIIKTSLLFALFIGIIYMCIAQCVPTYVVWVLPVLSSILFFAMSIICFTDTSSSWSGYHGLKILLGIVFLIASIWMASMLFVYRRHLLLCGILLKYTTRFLADSFCVYFYIPLFLLLTILALLLFFWQYVAFSTAGKPYTVQGDIYWRNQWSFFQILNIIQLLWGLQFLRDSFNFIVSGNAIEWYFCHSRTHCESPVRRLMTKHLGSVIGGSYLNMFFQIPDLIYDSLKCEKRGCMARYASSCQYACGSCDNLFELVRSDVYSYINLTGIPYCNAARNCELLCSRTNLFAGSHSCLQMFRAAANWTNIGIVLIMCYGLMRYRASDISVPALALVGIFAWCISTYFVGIHTDAGEGLQVTFLLEHSLEHDSYRTMIRCPPGLRAQIEAVDVQLNGTGQPGFGRIINTH